MYRLKAISNDFSTELIKNRKKKLFKNFSSAVIPDFLIFLVSRIFLALFSGAVCRSMLWLYN